MPKQGIEYLQSSEKRFLDLAGGTAVAVALFPAIVTVGAVSVFDTQSLNPFFVQQRTAGCRGRISAYKFRTLSRQTDDYAGSKIFGTFDPRASRVGQLVRQSGLDEAPQIYNVLNGDMSLVGPRPLSDGEIDNYSRVDTHLFSDWYHHYSQVKAGLTGESQLHRHHFDGITDEIRATSMRMDLAYMEQSTLADDLRWLGRTPLRMIAANIGVEHLETTT